MEFGLFTVLTNGAYQGTRPLFRRLGLELGHTVVRVRVSRVTFRVSRVRTRLGLGLGLVDLRNSEQSVPVT